MLPGTGSYTQPRKQIGEQYGREERRLPIHGAIQCRRPKPPAGSRYSERTGATQGTVSCQCRDPLHKLSRVTGNRSCAQDRPAGGGTVGTRDNIQYATGSHICNGGEYAQRFSACHGIRKYPVRCRRHAGGRWFPFAPELPGCDTGAIRITHDTGKVRMNYPRLFCVRRRIFPRRYSLTASLFFINAQPL